MKGRPTVFKDQEIVLKAQEVFWKKGYSATSLSDLSRATGAGAGSLYNTFKGGKKELFKKALAQRKEDLKAFQSTLKKSEHPVQLIKDFFLSLAAEAEKSHAKGCIIANTLVEMSFVDKELEKEAILILRETENLYKKTILEAQKNGSLKSKISADVLAKHLISLWCGINSLRRMYPDEKILQQQIELQLQIIN
ncbi:TetR/AcrR family transcriptional regulator [Zunongwangia endophytica]|uniref:TetR/AcrR family transcriptional regulator n=1 Tax=Zunongwangia endophytica TaxID=1808945 RepID=A0ABV8H490_9FLAO|nr:TetR/AcrR family transcriptional regulator [Zunongwangia endophytica]MDN3595561.1 TetR/AcrR family transcriptional regulator [Zunongwangia endophytica]